MKKVNIALYPCFVLSFVLILGCSQDHQNSCYEFNHKYSKLVERQKNQPDSLMLLESLKSIIEKNPTCLDAYLTRGDLNLLLDNYLQAKADFYKALRLDSLNVYALYKLGLIFQDEELYDSSQIVLNKAISTKTRGNFVIDYPNVGAEISTDKNKYDVLAMELLYRLGVSFYYQKNLSLALRYFNSCIENMYLPGKTYLFRGAVYFELNKVQEACEDFLQAKKYGNDEAVSYLKKYCLE